MDERSDLAQLMEELRAFTRARDWERFHSPKNLAMAVAGEAGELVAELQWVEREELDERLALGTDLRQRFTHELADVFIYLLLLADRCDINPIEAARTKIRLNEDRHPAKQARDHPAGTVEPK